MTREEAGALGAARAKAMRKATGELTKSEIIARMREKAPNKLKEITDILRQYLEKAEIPTKEWWPLLSEAFDMSFHDIAAYRERSRKRKLKELEDQMSYEAKWCIGTIRALKDKGVSPEQMFDLINIVYSDHILTIEEKLDPKSYYEE